MGTMLSLTPSKSLATDSVAKYDCVESNGTQTLMAHLSYQGQQDEAAIFHFPNQGLEGLPNSTQLCNTVKAKLQSNAGDGIFYGFAPHEVNGKPSVCLEKTAGTCDTVLFGLEPQGNINDSLFRLSSFLESILADDYKLSSRNEIDPTRPYGTGGYRVPLWRRILGF